ncbi:nicotinic acid plasma membrane transporter [Saitoella complicata NRRL Y-17804]|nr:nicotinic acid plasma membrane transporter [Saitoella complicata NRRL Y-17804]ODQ54277.1 nicotinic acid plasma membrane transporter [Saitoella complicata NRRL Y-17804]
MEGVTYDTEKKTVHVGPDIATGETEILIDPEAERRLLHKLDLHIIPVIMITYLVAFLDRSNVGNAKVAGMVTDLNLTGSKFNVLASIFYVTYIAFEIPTSTYLKKFGASKLIPAIVIAWSLVATFSAFVQSYGGMIAIRLLLGACEAGLFPCFNLYLSSLYKRDEQAKRFCMIFVAQALAGAFGGLLAYGILKMDGVAGWAGWRWLFCIEGLASLVVGVADIFLLPDSAESAYFLTPAEKDLVRLRALQSASYHGPSTPDIDWTQVRAAFRSPMVWLSGWIQMCTNTCLYGFSTFLPTIINGMGYTSVQAQYLTIPIYLLGAIIYFLTAIGVDRTQRRAPFMFFWGLFTVAGYCTLLSATKPSILYFACFLVAMGLYVFDGLNMLWLAGNVAPHYKRAVAIGMNQTIGNIGGVIAGQIYVARDSPLYRMGQGVSLAGILTGYVSAVGMFFLLRRLNRGKDVKRGEMGGVEGEDGLGDASPWFIYKT